VAAVPGRVITAAQMASARVAAARAGVRRLGVSARAGWLPVARWGITGRSVRLGPVPARPVLAAVSPVPAAFVPSIVASAAPRHVRSALDVGLPATTIVGEFAWRGWRVDETVPARTDSSGSARPPVTGQTATAAGGPPAALLLVPALDPRLLQQLAVLLLRHPLTALLDDRAQPGHHLSHKRQTGTPSHARSVGTA